MTNIKTTIPADPGISTPNAGTTQRPGKDVAQLDLASHHEVQTTFDAPEDKGAAKRALETQIFSEGDGNYNSNPKRRYNRPY